MTSEAQFSESSDSSTRGFAGDKLARLQADLVETVRIWARDEVSATMAHELNDPLTALLIYLHEIERAGVGRSDADARLTPVWELVGKASHEAGRVCAIVERMRQDVAAPSPQSAVAREVIEAWTHGLPRNENGARKARPAELSCPSLTPREREVLAQITAGASNKEGGYRLGISRRTFEMHRAHIMRKRGARNAADLVRMVLADPH